MGHTWHAPPWLIRASRITVWEVGRRNRSGRLPERGESACASRSLERHARVAEDDGVWPHDDVLIPPHARADHALQPSIRPRQRGSGYRSHERTSRADLEIARSDSSARLLFSATREVGKSNAGACRVWPTWKQPESRAGTVSARAAGNFPARDARPRERCPRPARRGRPTAGRIEGSAEHAIPR
jgi:hypothetical protein